MDFQGFQNTFPNVLIVIAIVALLAISWFSYRKTNNIPPLPRYILITLRALALIIVFLLLMNPYFYSSNQIELKPKIAVFLDNSESVGIERGEYRGMSSYNSLLQSINFESVEEAEIEYYSIEESSAAFNPDSLDLTAPQTNLSSAVNTILEMEEDVRAAIIISDGIITYGKNPAFNASSSSIPLHTIALGDTVEVRDISISNVLTNSTGYTNTKHIIEAEVTQSGFEGSAINVALVSGDETILEKEVSFETDDQVKNIEFELELEEEGLKQYEIKTEPLPDEWSPFNNSKSFSIDVLDSRVKILHIAFEIHPDVKTVRSIISEDVNNEISTLTWLSGNRFSEELPQEMDFDLLIIHGTPNQNRSFDFLENMTSTPVLVFSTSSYSNAGTGFIKDVQLIESDANQFVRINLYRLLNADEQPILELPDINLDETPPLISPLRTTATNLQSENLFSMKYNNLATENPVVTILEQGNIRHAHVFAWNWYKMYQSTSSQHRAFATELITNLVSWTSSDPDDRNLQVYPTKQSFSTVESPSINASLQNESGEMESGAIIEVEIISGDNTSRTYNMENSGNGNYTLNLPRFSEGLYEYEATARKGNREIDRQQGEFLVSNTSSELTNTTRNDQLLRSLSANSGGLFFTYDNTEGFWDSLRTTQVFESQKQTLENYEFPVRSFFWFIVVLFLLSTEWITRKYYSLP
ncbi:MAG: hypothetical protein WD059_09245 [Balneolaceae bacterium]